MNPSATYTIRAMRRKEIPLFKEFPPDDWHFDMPAFLSRHLGRSYFFAVVAELDRRPVGVGNGIRNDRVGWLGNIIVVPDHRGRGIGTALTRTIMDRLEAGGCRSLQLIATRDGEPLYRRLGFTVSSRYIFLRGNLRMTCPDRSAIKPFCLSDRAALLEMDATLCGEQRRPLLEEFLDAGWIYRQNDKAAISGYFLPGFGSGFIAAVNDRAGHSLLCFKHSGPHLQEVVPEQNRSAVELLTAEGFSETGRAPRMIRGEPVAWRPESIYARASGYTG